MERKGQRNTRRQRRSRSWLFSPVIIAQLAVVMVIAGVGVAFALPTPTTINTTASPWAGNAAISGSDHVTVSTYTLGYTTQLDKVASVTLHTVASQAANATLKMVILNGASSVVGSGTEAHVYGGAGPYDWVVTFTTPIALTDVGTLNVIVTEP